LPIDDAARKGLMKALQKAVKEGGIDSAYKLLQEQFGNKADDIIRQVANATGSKIEIHHIISDKAIESGFTDAYKKIFDRAGMSLNDPLNKMILPGHSGGHTKEYKQFVLRYITDATNGLSGEKAKAALTKALKDLREMLNMNQKMP